MRQYFPDIDEPVFELSVSTYIKGSPKSLAIAPDEIAKAVAWMNTGAEKKVSVAYKSIVVPGPAEQAATADTRK
jgi:hypothetical protein